MVMESVANYLKNGDKLANIRELIEKHHQLSSSEYDTAFSNQTFIDLLIDDYKEWGNIIIAYDFDDTIQPSKPSFSCDLVVELLQICSKLDFTMICFTARTLEKDIQMVRDTCKRLNIRCDYINEDCDQIKQTKKFEHATKISFNIFLDNRAGLRQSYEVLWGFIEWFVNQDVNDIDSRKEGY